MATISIADNDARIQHSIGGSGNTANSTQFTIDFPFFSLDDINVIITNSSGVDTALTRGSGANTFAVSGTSVDDGFSGGYVTLGSVYTSSTVTIFRDIPVTRTSDFATSGPFNIAALNTELDRVIAIEQELETNISRTLKLPDSDGTVSTTLPNVDTRKGKTLAFNATSGAVEAGPSVSAVTTVADISADISSLADIEDGTTATDAISGLAAIKANVTTVAGIASNVTNVAGNASNINSAVSNASNINSAVSNASNINAAVSNASNINAAVSNASNINAVVADANDIGTVATNITNVNSVAAKSSLITSDFVSDLNQLAVTDVINDINLLATSDIVSDLNTLATSDIVSDLNTLATSDIVSDVNTLATSDIVTDLNLLATSDFVSDLNTLATSGNVTAINNVSGSIANVNTAATALNEITSFNDLFSVGSSAPSSPSAGDLWYDTTNSSLKVYVGSSFQTAGAYLQGLTTTHVFTATGNQTTFTTDDASATMSIFANGNTLVFKNGIRLVEGSNSTNDYYISGNNVVLNAGATAGDVLYVEVFTKVSTTQETSLNTLVSNATTQANNASTSAATSSTQATNSANSATASANSATASATSATNSANSATASASSATSAASSATSAAASFDDLDDRYLGAKSAAPSVDNDGDALGTGALYWNTSTNKLFVWDGSAWQQGSFTAGALLANLLEDTSPQLGGDLDVVTHSIVSTSDRNIAITPNGTGSVVLDGINYPQADGSNGQFLQTDGSGQLAFATVSTPTLSSLGLANHNNLSVDGSGNVALGASSISFGTSKWGIVLDGNDLDFQYNGTTVFKLASNGAVTSANDITAFGSP